MEKPPSKCWYIETSDGQRVVRGTAAGMILSDALIDPSLYDQQTAKKIADELMGMLSLHGHVIGLVVKKQPEHRA